MQKSFYNVSQYLLKKIHTQYKRDSLVFDRKKTILQYTALANQKV